MLLRPYQERLVSKAVAALNTRGNTLAVSPTGSGKCLGKGTPVLMFDGTVIPVEDVRVGDLLMGPDSKPRRVESLARGTEELFRVVPLKGDAYVVNRSHILSLIISGNDNVAGHKPGSIVNISVHEYLKQHKTFRHCAKGWRTGIDFRSPENPLPLPPYILGVWLGDGSNHNCNGFASPDPEIIAALDWYAFFSGVHVRHEKSGKKCAMHFITNGAKGRSNTFKTALRGLNLPHNKHIPHCYKTAARPERLELLAGLIDTDGSLSNDGYDFISKDKRLSEDVVFLARSLGLAAYLSCAMKKAQSMTTPQQYWRVSISGDCSIIPCRVTRKKASARRQIKDVLRTGIKVEPIGRGDYYGFELSGPDRLFLLGDFTVTHNTIMLAALAGRIGGKQCVLQHRQELTEQNLTKFKKVNPGARVSLYNADVKSWSGDTTFAMVQTLARNGNLNSIPALDLLTIDEAHHATADSYQRIIEAVLDKNPNCKIAGFTATPARGDGKGLRTVFDNCCDQISLNSLIALGFLVKPRTFVCALEGVDEELKHLRKMRGGEYDLAQAADVLDVDVHNAAVVREWRKLAGERRTIVFCSTVEHARHVCEAFTAEGVRAATVTGEMPDHERAATITRFDKGNIQVLVNVAVLTEGYDSQPVSCVILLRPCSFKSTMLQMIGRGLRTVDPALYPGVVKTDCIVMDFGRSLLTHGDLESKVQFEDKQKVCPECGGEVPCGTMECPICGHEFTAPEAGEAGEGEGRETVSSVEMMEVDILNASPFKWIDLFGTSKVMIASGFECWCAVISPDGEHWSALGKLKEERFVHRLQLGERIPCLAAADDFLRLNESDNAAKKNKAWLNHPATEKQMEYLYRFGYGAESQFAFTKYSAVCTMNFFFNQNLIEREIFQ